MSVPLVVATGQYSLVVSYALQGAAQSKATQLMYREISAEANIFSSLLVCPLFMLTLYKNININGGFGGAVKNVNNVAALISLIPVLHSFVGQSFDYLYQNIKELFHDDDY